MSKGKQKYNKFKTGNIVVHAPTRSKWIILDRKEAGRVQGAHVEAYCLYSGSKPEYWLPNTIDTWILSSQDLEQSDKIWRVEHAA